MSDRDSITVAIVGAGEMGAAVGRRLHEAGARVVTSLAGRSADSVARVRKAGVEVVNDDDSLVRDASFVLSIVPPGVAVEVAKRLSGPIRRADEPPVYVECNAISPATCRRICELFDARRTSSMPASSADRPLPALRIPQRVRAITHQAATLIC